MYKLHKSYTNIKFIFYAKPNSFSLVIGTKFINFLAKKRN